MIREGSTVAMITDASMGYVDHIGYCLTLTFDIDRRGGTFLSFSDLFEIGKMMNAAKVGDPLDLKGKACYVYEENDYIRFDCMWDVD